ncbi:MAG: ATP-binding cassette domain-containing protein [Rubrivivax sp.]
MDLRQTLRHRASRGAPEQRFSLQLAWRSQARRLVLFGPSGAGKSQTLKLIAGLAQPDAGHVRLAGQTLVDRRAGINLSPQRRQLAYVFQDYALFPQLSVRQNIGFALHGGWRNPPRGFTHPALERWIDAFELGAVQHQLPHQLSGGQRQRTALARALVHEPRALLLDEPFAALDRALRQRLRAELAELQTRLALPMLLITHDEDDLRLLADEVLHLQHGRLVQPTNDPSDGNQLGTPGAGL